MKPLIGGGGFEGLLLGGYMLLAAICDAGTGTLPLMLLASGGVSGVILRLAVLFAGRLSLRALFLRYGTGLFLGVLLLAGSRLTRGKIGRGDGLYLLSLSFWLRAGELFGLLMAALALLSLWGGGKMLFFHEKRGLSLPFAPFLAAVYLLGIALGGIGGGG